MAIVFNHLYNYIFSSLLVTRYQSCIGSRLLVAWQLAQGIVNRVDGLETR